MEGFCRGCLLHYDEPTDLWQYTEKNRRLFVYATGLQVKRNDTFIFQLCKECYFQMRQSCKFKKQCRTSDKKFRNYLMLKEDGEDFGSFIKNHENLFLRLPLTSGHSTPRYQKNKDEDTESTCTSIRNFMTDILEGEEMAPTEARIIREVIEEEADVLDDSLDSHWLQDDLSIASDFDIDFGISPFATPRSANNGSFTPRSTSEAKQREINYLTSKEIIEKIDKPRISQKFDMPSLDIDLDGPVNIYDMPKIIKEEYHGETVEKKPVTPDLQFDNSIPSEVEDMVTENSLSSTLQCFKTDLLKDLAVKKQMDIENDNCNFATFYETEIVTANVETKIDKDAVDTETDVCIVVNQGLARKKGGELTNDLDYYVNKTELKREIISTKDNEDYHCTIDRNLAIALKKGRGKEFALDQLIVTPAVSVRSGVSTPTINNILFGDENTDNRTSTPMIKNILFGKKLGNEPKPKYFPQVGQSLEDFEDSKSDILENFLKDNENIRMNIKTNTCAIKAEPEDIFDECHSPREVNLEIKREDHIDVLEDFLREADDQTKVNEDIIDQIIDPEEIIKLSDKELFKRPLTPPYDKYDLDKCFCKICERPFSSSKALKIHFAKTHNYKFPNSDPHRNKSQNAKIKLCDICGKDVKGVANYMRHMRSHDVESLTDIFQCDICTGTYKSRMALQVHMRVHNNMAPIKKRKQFVCETCGKVSGSSSHHKLHIRRHFKEISASCDICHKGFYSTRELNVHVRITHNFERPFKCPHCTNSYKRRDNLNQHIKQHLGITPHKCDICNVQFVTETNLASHFKSIACIMKRKAASRREKEKVTVQFRKGSMDKIKKLMECNEEVTYDVVSNASDLMEVDIGRDVETNQEVELDQRVEMDQEVEPSEMDESNKESKVELDKDKVIVDNSISKTELGSEI